MEMRTSRIDEVTALVGEAAEWREPPLGRVRLDIDRAAR
jgi:hypothetical protein